MLYLIHFPRLLHQYTEKCLGQALQESMLPLCFYDRAWAIFPPSPACPLRQSTPGWATLALIHSITFSLGQSWFFYFIGKGSDIFKQVWRSICLYRCFSSKTFGDTSAVYENANQPSCPCFALRSRCEVRSNGVLRNEHRSQLCAWIYSTLWHDIFSLGRVQKKKAPGRV